MGTERPLGFAEWMRWVEKRLRNLDSRIASLGAGDTGPVTPGFANGWVANGGGYEAPTYRAVTHRGGLVEVTLQGTMKDGTWGVAAFTLPTGLRPAGTLPFPVRASSGAERVDVLANGTVVPQSPGTGWCSITGISFIATP